MRTVKCLVWGLLSLLCLTMAFSASRQVQEMYPAFGLRYRSLITERQVEAVEEYQEKLRAEGDRVIGASFWKQERRTVSTPRAQVEADAVSFYGSGADCYGTEFIEGGMPGAGDAAGCAISEQTAWELFGATRVTGLKVTLAVPDEPQSQGRVYTVRGVFRGDAAVVLAGADKSEGFSCVELTGALSGDQRGQAVEFALASGLGEPDEYCYGNGAAVLARALCFAPLFFAGLCLTACLLRMVQLVRRPWREAVWFALALALALCLPFVLEALPAWLIPAQWSDLSFWPQLWQTCWERLREWFAMTPYAKDVVAKLLLLGCGLWTTGAAVCLAVLRRAAKGREAPPPDEDGTRVYRTRGTLGR